MNKRKSLLFILMLTIFSTNIVKAECTTEEENNIRKEIDKIEIEYMFNYIRLRMINLKNHLKA